MDPAGRGYAAMIREFARMTDNDRQKFRDRILEMMPQGLQDAAQRFFEKTAGNVAVFASEERLKTANERLDGKLRMEPLLPQE